MITFSDTVVARDDFSGVLWSPNLGLNLNHHATHALLYPILMSIGRGNLFIGI